METIGSTREGECSKHVTSVCLGTRPTTREVCQAFLNASDVRVVSGWSDVHTTDRELQVAAPRGVQGRYWSRRRRAAASACTAGACRAPGGEDGEPRV